MEEEAYGMSTKRYLDNARLDAKLPEGAEWHNVKVKYHGSASVRPGIYQTTRPPPPQVHFGNTAVTFSLPPPLPPSHSLGV